MFSVDQASRTRLSEANDPYIGKGYPASGAEATSPRLPYHRESVKTPDKGGVGTRTG